MSSTTRSPPAASNSSTNLKGKNTKDDISLKDIMSSLKSLHTEIQSIKSKLLIQENTSSVILNKLETLTSDILSLKNENIDLRKEIDILRNKSCNHTSISSPDLNNLDIVQELNERESKCRNIIIFNANEQEDDKPLINNLFSNLKLKFTFKSTSRVGKLSNKPRPIRIELNSADDVLHLLKSKRDLYNTSDYKHLWITTDLTQYQRRILSSMKTERDRRNVSDNNKWYIRYIRGNPNLVQKN